MIHFILLINRQGKTRLVKWYSLYTPKQQTRILREIGNLVVNRPARLCNFLEWKTYKIIYKRYASLYFAMCVDVDDNELIALETLHHFVVTLDQYFGNVCELDIIFNFHRVYFIVDEVFMAGELQETSKKAAISTITQVDQITDLEKKIISIYSTFSTTPLTSLEKSDMLSLFPQASSYFFPTKEVTINSITEDYLLQVGVLNQLVIISKQLLHDISSLDNHKYIAHQIALLYQSVGKVGPPLVHIKRNIESRFDEIKATTEQQGKIPTLNENQITWMRALLEDVLKEVFALPLPLTGNIQSLLNFAN